MKNKYSKLLILAIMTFDLSLTAFANNAESIREVEESARCCAPNGISYCDRTAGHYVCNDGGYSACICTETAPVSTYRQLALGCCLWHGGVAKDTMGKIICGDGTTSDVCSLQNPLISDMSTN